MGVTDVPQWLPAAFVRSARAVGATADREEIEATCARLLERWRAPDRHFHNVKHVVDMLARVDELAQETHDPDLVRLAAWYHGAVFSSAATKAYARSGGEDERASAALAREELGALGVPEPALDRVEALILGLKRHESPGKDIDCMALNDADLAVLAADPQRYGAYRKAVRAEYAHLPLRHYLEARIAIISKLLARRNIFVSPMGQQWEDAARENLTAELERLEAELTRLGACRPEDTVAAAEAAHGEGESPAAPAQPAEPRTNREQVPERSLRAEDDQPGRVRASVSDQAHEPEPSRLAESRNGRAGVPEDARAKATVRRVNPQPAARRVTATPSSAGEPESPTAASDDSALPAGPGEPGVVDPARTHGERAPERPASPAGPTADTAPEAASSLEALPEDLAPRGPAEQGVPEERPQSGIEREPDLLTRPRKKRSR